MNGHWITNETPPRILTVKGTSLVDPDVFVAEDETTGKTHWIVKAGGYVCGLGDDKRRVYATPALSHVLAEKEDTR